MLRQSGGTPEPGGSGIADAGCDGWNVPFDVKKATRLDLLSLHAPLYFDHSIATTARTDVLLQL